MEERYIGNYRVLEKIGAGGMAQVFLAVHRDVPNLKVILKIVSDGQLAERFKQEADKLALLDGNASICRIRHFFNDGDNLVIAMEYIEGVTLDERLKREAVLPIDESLRITAKVLEVLEFAHQRKIFHRDIKPSNIMIDKAGNVKVIDFGIAKSETDPNLTLAGTACGTPAYMAPEQFTPTAQTNYALVDIYAAGTTLYYLLTGALPFKGDNEFAMRDAKLFSEPPRPRSIKASIPREIEEIVLKAIDKEPKARYQTAEEMRRAVDDAARRLGEKDDVATKAVSTSNSVAKRKRGSLRFVLPVAGVLILAAIAAYLFWPSSPPIKTGALALIGPVSGETLNTGQPTLRWSDPQERNSFVLEYALDSSFAGSRTIAGLSGGSYTFSSSLPNGTYYWRLYPVTAAGSPGDPSPWAYFSVNATSIGASGTISIAVTPSGDIYLNDILAASGQSSFERQLDTGRYVLRIENEKSREKRLVDTADIGPDAVVSRRYSFTIPAPTPTPPSPPPVTAKSGEVRIGSQPRGADIVIDGELQRQKTNYTFKLSPGRHVIVAALEVDGVTRRLVDTVVVVADSVHKVAFEFEQ
ncbi:MAG: serine/threonine-protein kinase [candidate division Zixibacteria bacterium]|jgi:serine/threonine protein kinase|nr:serine/threonine-protein kinase [candidate division Zixibacteria bacterium]